VGSTSLSLTQTGLTMNGMNMQVTGSLSAQISAVSVSVSGSATTQISGGIVMIG
jgi:hypothetical protein